MQITNEQLREQELSRLPGTPEQREFAREMLQRVLKMAKGGNWRTTLRMALQEIEEPDAN